MTEAASTAIVHFASAPSETTTSRPPADRLLKGDPEQIVRNYFSDSTGQFFAGVWESTPGRWRVRYSENEFCHITRGRVRIADAAGQQWVFAAGDSFVIPAGFSGVWEVQEPTSKLYVIFEAASR
ncbi:MAG: cupin domain-containing protein [Steroidobacter sp.]